MQTRPPRTAERGALVLFVNGDCVEVGEWWSQNRCSKALASLGIVQRLPLIVESFDYIGPRGAGTSSEAEI